MEQNRKPRIKPLHMRSISLWQGSQEYTVGDFPGGPVVKSSPCRGTWVQSLIEELRPHMLRSNWACALQLESLWAATKTWHNQIDKYQGSPVGSDAKESACRKETQVHSVLEIPWRRKWQPTPVLHKYFLKRIYRGKYSLFNKWCREN